MKMIKKLLLALLAVGICTQMCHGAKKKKQTATVNQEKALKKKARMLRTNGRWTTPQKPVQNHEILKKLRDDYDKQQSKRVARKKKADQQQSKCLKKRKEKETNKKAEQLMALMEKNRKAGRPQMQPEHSLWY